MYTAFAGVGLIVAFFIHRKVLTSQHEETKTGLEAEREHAAERQAERAEKRESKRQSQLLSAGNSRPVSQNVSRAHIEPVEETEEKPRDLEEGLTEAEKSRA
jgi:flagellar biosynthesis/type III secretory pathway M-ring protein FliF/YscJ